MRVSSIRATLLLLCIVLGAGGCIRRGRDPGPKVWRAPGARAGVYDGDGRGEPALVQRKPSDALRAAVESGARARGVTLTGDGRLGQLASYAAEHAPGGAMPSRLVEELSRHLGLYDPVIDLVIEPVPPGEPSAPLWAALERALGARTYTHYGAALFNQDGKSWLALALSQRRLELDPVPSKLPVRAPLAVRGRLPEGFTRARLDILAAGAPRVLLPAGPERAFNVQVPTERRGLYRIEILGDGPQGTEVFAKLPVYVGIDAPTAFEQRQPEVPRDLAHVRAKLLEEIQRQRYAAGLAPLVESSTLDALAEQHSRDMRDHGFFGHESPRTGGPAERVQQAGLGSSLVLENVLRGADIAQLQPQPRSGEQQNVLDRDVTHVGIGVVEASDAHGAWLLATQLFAALSSGNDTGLAEPTLLANINATRAQRGQQALQLDRALSNVAREAAQSYFASDDATEQSAVERANQQLARFSVLYERVNAVIAVTRTLEPIATLEPPLDPDARNIGIGVAEGDRGQGRTLAVVLVLAYPR